jgi:protein-S-isoprenylcysteine O-methyltransferase Ste14
MTAGVALGAAFGLGWLPLFLFRAEALTDALPRYHGAERLWVAVTPMVLALHVTGTCVAITLAPAIQWRAAVVGLGLFGAAIAFWFWGRVMIGPLRVRRLPDEPPLRLQQRGAFGVVRHPLYFGYLLAAAAPLALVPRIPFFLTFALCCVALAVRAVQEERRLRLQLGAAYVAYCRRVRRLVPYVW